MVQKIEDKDKQKAEIHSHYGRFDNAERLYKDMDRKDLIVEMRMKIGDWQKVIKLAEKGFASDEIKLKAYNNLAQDYADKFQWKQAVKYFLKAKNYPALITAYTNIHDY